MRLAGLYIIADISLPALQPLTEKAILNLLQPDVNLLQYRDKQSSVRKRKEYAALFRLCCGRRSIPLIINDDIGLMRQVNADGVHLGRHDMPVAQAREFLGKEKIIGASCYQSLQRAQAAHNDGASYVAFGAVFPSLTKPAAQQISLETLADYRRRLNLPVCAIGGITTTNINKVLRTNVDMVAVAGGILRTAGPTRQVNRYLEAMKGMDY